MSSLNNLYISQSYQGLLHFGSNTTSSAQLGIIEDGLGNSLGLYLNNNGDLRTTTSISSSTIEATNLKIKNKIEITGSIDIDGPVTASNVFIENNLIVSGTIRAYEIHTTIESSSVIFSSGSNILGDSTADTQTLNGKVIVSGSEEITGSLFVRNDISSSTLNGIGNVTLYSQSVDARLDFLEGPFSTSVDQRLDSLESATASLGYVTTGSFFAFTSSVDDRFVAVGVSTSSLNVFTASANSRLNNLESTSASVNLSLSSLNGFTQSQDTKNSTLGAYTASVDTKFSTLSSYTASNDTKWSTIQSYTASIDSKFSTLALTTASLISKTGSYATTGSNTFTGSQVFSGSVNGQVFGITVASNTASMNCSLGNFFTVTLGSGSTRFEATNITPGQTLSLKILNSTSGSQFTGSVSVKFPNGFNYIPTTVTGSTDIITFLSFDNSAIYAVAANYFV